MRQSLPYGVALQGLKAGTASASLQPQGEHEAACLEGFPNQKIRAIQGYAIRTRGRQQPLVPELQ